MDWYSVFHHKTTPIISLYKFTFKIKVTVLVVTKMKYVKWFSSYKY